MAWQVDPDRLLRRSLRASDGYLSLGMIREAWEELEVLPEDLRARPESLLQMARLLHACGRWDEAIDLSKVGTEAYPNVLEFYFLRASMLEARGMWWEARATLLGGPGALRQTDLFHYNLARCEAGLGNLDRARRELKQAIAINGKLREMARTDPIFQDLLGG